MKVISRTLTMLTVRHALVGACALAMALASPAGAAAQTTATQRAAASRTFATPEEAAKALVDTVRKGDVDALLAIFGPDGKELLDSSDRATARMNQQVFTIAAAERWYLEDAAPNRRMLIIGNEEWPFPVPLVKDATAWRFDTAAGKEEILARRIGRNELETIATVRAYATAQQRYAAQGHDGKPSGIYATKLASDPGRQNGLYWPTTKGQPRSPLGELVAQAAEGGRAIDNTQQSPFHGYMFKILTSQGAAASGGARSYIVKGEMSGGFAMVAWPAQYDATGVMTFIIGNDGIVRQKDLGPDTDAVVRKMTAFNPDSSWQRVP
jgi:hypothetical protein